MKNQRSQRKNLRFAENRVEKITRQIVRQTEIVGGRRTAFPAESDNALLARIYDNRRRAIDYLLRVQAFC